MKDPLVNLPTPSGKPFYVRPSEVLSIHAHGTRPDNRSWVIQKSGPHIDVLGCTPEIAAVLAEATK